jgi:hypothetical protein
MGKPFQEEALLENIESLLTVRYEVKRMVKKAQTQVGTN